MAIGVDAAVHAAPIAVAIAVAMAVAMAVARAAGVAARACMVDAVGKAEQCIRSMPHVASLKQMPG